MEHLDRRGEHESIPDTPGLPRRIRRVVDSSSALTLSCMALCVVGNSVQKGSIAIWFMTVIFGFLTGVCVTLSVVIRRVHRYLLDAAATSHPLR